MAARLAKVPPMTSLRLILSVAVLALPMLASGAKADNASASQISAAGHGRRPILTNRPSRQIYHRQRYGHAYGFRHARRPRY